METNLKICLTSMAPFVGGAEVAAERLALGLREAGHEVVVVLGNDGVVRERMVRAGLRCVYTPMFLTDKWHWLRYLHARHRLRQLFRRERPDVIHSNDLPTHQMTSHAARGLGIPRICHHRFPFDGRAIDWLTKYGAERHLFVSRAFMEEMIAASAGLRASSRAAIHDGLPLPPLPSPSDRLEARSALGLPAGKTIVLFVGQIIERKGVADLIRAWALLTPQRQDGAELVLVGDDLEGKGQYRTAMEQLATSLNCPVRFVGFQNPTDPWIKAADVVVLPSHVEPLGLAIMEGMSYGVATLGATTGGIPEMIVPEETGLLVSPGKPDQLAAALARLLGDEVLRARLGRNGRQRCETHFSLAAHARAVVHEYRTVLATPTPAGAP
jgi:glycosyltransferase involved in cell wall biosynthesis